MKHETFPPVTGQSDAQRRDDRVPFEMLAEVKLGFGPWRRARLHDVSVTGFRLGALPSASVVLGSEVRIRIPGLEALAAVVRRRDTAGVGCEFTRPLSIYVLEHMARQGGH